MFTVKKVPDVKEMLADFPNRRTTIWLKTIDAVGCELATDAIAEMDVPHFNRSTVDGYAVNHKDCLLASVTVPVLLKNIGSVEMGEDSSLQIEKNTIYVPTGGFLPTGADCVVMIENTEVLGEEIVIYQAPSIYENVLRMGTDVSKREVLLQKGTVLHSRNIGLLAAAGVLEVEVYKPLTAVVISTGDEIVPPHKTPKVGEIRDINTYTVKIFLESRGVNVVKTIVVRDDYRRYFNELDNAAKAVDIVVASGGSSVGDKDYTIDVLKEMEAKIYAHGINIKPGKPTIVADYFGKLILGLPGQPLSAYTVLSYLFDDYMVSQGVHRQQFIIDSILLQPVHAAPGRVTVQLVKLTSKGVEPIFTKSGMIHGLARADGYVVIDENSEGLNKGEQVEVILFD